MHIFQINILIFNFLCVIRVLNPRVHLQEESCIYTCGMIRDECNNISSLVDRRIY